MNSRFGNFIVDNSVLELVGAVRLYTVGFVASNEIFATELLQKINTDDEVFMTAT